MHAADDVRYVSMWYNCNSTGTTERNNYSINIISSTYYMETRIARLENRNAETGVAGDMIPLSYSPVSIVRYREPSLHATLSITLTPCKSMEGGLWFLLLRH